MTELQKNISDFLDDCRYMKGLSDKTLKAYTIDLRQFSEFCLDKSWNEREPLDEYIKALYMKYKPKTAKRKVACLKTFFHYLENNDLIPTSPFHKIVIKRREPLVLPKVIPVPTLTKILEAAYIKHSEAAHSACFYRFTIRDIAVMELLFATGVRVYELCNLKINDVDLKDKCIKVYGKGSKERYIQLTNKDVISALKQYQKEYAKIIRYYPLFIIQEFNSAFNKKSKNDEKNVKKAHILFLDSVLCFFKMYSIIFKMTTIDLTNQASCKRSNY